MMNTTASARKLKAKSQIYFRIFLSTVEFDFKWNVSPLQEKKMIVSSFVPVLVPLLP